MENKARFVPLIRPRKVQYKCLKLKEMSGWAGSLGSKDMDLRAWNFKIKLCMFDVIFSSFFSWK